MPNINGAHHADSRGKAPAPGIPALEKALRDLIAVARPLLDVPADVHVKLPRLLALGVAADAAQSILDKRAGQPRMFVVEVQGKAGTYISECEPVDRETVIRDLFLGQHDDPVRVLEVTDASREIAAAVAEHSDAEQVEPVRDAVSWCERNGAEPYREPAERDPDEWRDSWLEMRRAEIAR